MLTAKAALTQREPWALTQTSMLPTFLLVSVLEENQSAKPVWPEGIRHFLMVPWANVKTVREENQ